MRNVKLSRQTSVPGEPRILTTGSATFRRLFKKALRDGNIWPVFQPIVSLRSGHLIGFEVLARWKDPTDGDLSPAMFIPRLEGAQQQIGDEGMYENAGEYIRALIRHELQSRDDAWDSLQKELAPAMRADDSEFVAASDEDVIRRNKRH